SAGNAKHIRGLEVSKQREGRGFSRVVDRVYVVRRAATARGWVEGRETEVRGRGTCRARRWRDRWGELDVALPADDIGRARVATEAKPWVGGWSESSRPEMRRGKKGQPL